MSFESSRQRSRASRAIEPTLDGTAHGTGTLASKTYFAQQAARSQSENEKRLSIGDTVSTPCGKGKVTKLTKGTIKVRIGRANPKTFHPDVVMLVSKAP